MTAYSDAIEIDLQHDLSVAFASEQRAQRDYWHSLEWIERLSLEAEDLLSKTQE